MPFVAAAKALLAQGRPPETMLVAHHRGSRIVALRATLAVAAAWKPSVLVPKPSIERLASYASTAEADADRERLIVARDALLIAKNTLGLDECGLWCLQGSRGRITTWGEGEWLLFSTTHERTVREWRFIVRSWIHDGPYAGGWVESAMPVRHEGRAAARLTPSSPPASPQRRVAAALGGRRWRLGCVLCYFGWPRAHEDDAERAGRAGLAAVEAVASLHAPDGQGLSARVGIATGLVVVGDLIGEGAAQQEAVVGDTPNLAARLQGLAQPSQVVIAATTRRLLADTFEVVELGDHALKGIDGLTSVYAVVAERAATSRFDARTAASVTAMVGRDHELGLVLEKWQQAKAGDGQFVLLTGEAGIGKSRVVRATIDELAEEPHLRISHQCSPYFSDSALYPVIQQLAFAIGSSAGDSASDKLDKLEAIVRGRRRCQAVDRCTARDRSPASLRPAGAVARAAACPDPPSPGRRADRAVHGPSGPVGGGGPALERRHHTRADRALPGSGRSLAAS